MSPAQPLQIASARLCLPNDSTGEEHGAHGGFSSDGEGRGLFASWALKYEVGRQGRNRNSRLAVRHKYLCFQRPMRKLVFFSFDMAVRLKSCQSVGQTKINFFSP